MLKQAINTIKEQPSTECPRLPPLPAAEMRPVRVGIIERIPGAGIRFRKATHVFCLVFAAVMIFPMAAFCEPERLVNSSDYKDKDFRKGCISDYGDMVKGDDIDWVWVSPGITLGGHKLNIARFENKSDGLRSSQEVEIKSIFREFFGKIKGDKGTLTADMCIYEVQKFSAGKAWIPFAGVHQMQTGVGVELKLKDKGGKTIAKFRHFAREGARVEDAAQEVAEDLKKYIADH